MALTSKVDSNGKCLRFDHVSRMMRVDGAGVFKVVVKGDEFYIQFYDGDRMRSEVRGTRLIEVPLTVLNQFIEKNCG